MADEFIQEINDDLQAERIRTIAGRVGIVALGVILACGVGVGVWEWQQHTLHLAQNKASVAYMDAMQMRNSPDGEPKAVGTLADLAAHAPQGVRGYAAMALADLKQKSHDTSEALSLWKQVSDDTKAEPALRKMARYLSLNAQMDTASPEMLRQGYQNLVQEGGSWASLAREGLAVLDMRADATKAQKNEARRLLVEVKMSPDSSESLRDRAGLLLQTLGDAG
ncbi:tetratricopeptide repeat protein [Saccharibacter floricola]|uniref:Tetratricopeptide repeat-like domain-containing protein n=1 Tax=Saccharibacter floricola DSM 15669 TaxID=1123227 RepID=A0ABQ0NWA5_9PROT|nr:tetratricopeptide repeat protein [Saccharibacter floricola]GBQ04764.1 hypothetical protein AA15669_0134 [Saccharibacter floricola DSM 15669]